MRVQSIIVSIMLLLAATMGVTAQQRTLPSREALDSLVNPSLSDIAARMIAIEPTTIDLGEVGDDAPINILFTIANTTTEPITITEIRTSCSCLKVTSGIEHLAAAESARLRAEFNPRGRNGEFLLRVLVYTSQDATRPAARLDIEGMVVASDIWGHLPESMGTLRLSRKSVTLDGVRKAITRTERIAIANSGTRDLRLTAQSTTPGITLRTEPEILAPGAEGDIVISYTPTEEVTTDMETMLVVEGCEARASERVIRITIKR